VAVVVVVVVMVEVRGWTGRKSFSVPCTSRVNETKGDGSRETTSIANGTANGAVYGTYGVRVFKSCWIEYRSFPLLHSFV
jgi:hypothetical protein